MQIPTHSCISPPPPPPKQGNGYKLTHTASNFFESGVRTAVAAEFVPGFWRQQNGRPANREELMMTLANVEHILIRLLYTDQTQREVEVLNIVMDSAGVRDRGLGSATLVEECRCPSGYTGLSCENCAHGYVRQKAGPWLGRCAPDAEPCRPGTYGDPFNGVPCKECPCPLAGGQNFARTCSLLPNGGDVRCDCKQGYAGTRCEVCAAGYAGNPLAPGGSCDVVPVSRCDPRGTATVGAGGRCECKQFATGPLCNQCTTSAYHLNERSNGGCTECFCMGVSQQCTSSSWYRDTVRAYPADGQFALISDLDNPEELPIDIRVTYGQEVTARFEPSDTHTYWWKLPPAFVGNQLAAYGGHLNYTVRFATQPGGVMSRNAEPDVVIRSRNDYTMMHYRGAEDELQPTHGQSYAVRIAEDQWQRPEGDFVTREHLLMALADVTDMFVKATYTTTSSSAGLLAVAMDTASPAARGGAGVRASEVEQCACPEGHEGLSCERCSPGYGRDPDGGDGLYLGLCRLCQCNGHAQDCDAETSVCQQCRHNTAGDQCEQCAPGFHGNATLGTAYDCQEIEQPDQRGCSECDPRGTATCDEGGCLCKSNVEGYRCDRCRAGTFGLNETNRMGCTECFCAGVTRSCAAAQLYRLPIPINPFDDRLTLTDRRAAKLVGDADVQLDISNNRYSYRLTEDAGRDTLYWSLPQRFVGNQVLSYGGVLQFTVSNEAYGPYVRDQDVLLIGNGLQLFWLRRHTDEATSEVRLVESEWQSTDRNNGLRPASRADLLTVLSDLQSILVRATLREEVSLAYISDILLDTAVQQQTAVPADNVEKCHCPAGYRGTSCEVSEGL